MPFREITQCWHSIISFPHERKSEAFLTFSLRKMLKTYFDDVRNSSRRLTLILTFINYQSSKTIFSRQFGDFFDLFHINRFARDFCLLLIFAHEIIIQLILVSISYISIHYFSIFITSIVFF